MTQSFEQIKSSYGLANELVKARKYEYPIAVLWGAGCSFSAGIPLANGMIEEIKKQFPSAYHRCTNENPHAGYANLMNELEPKERTTFIRQMVSDRKINWAHFLLAELVRRKHVSRVFTTNFDPLLPKACALLRADISIYDLAASPSYVDHLVVDPAVFYLHGQQHGFFQKNTSAETRAQARAAEGLFQHAHDYVWIVMGYSADNDALFPKFIESGKFNRGLYWCYLKKYPPQKQVLKVLNGKGAVGVEIEGADEIMLQIARALNCFPPVLVDQPFSHLQELVREVGIFGWPRAETNLMAFAAGMLTEATSKIERAKAWEKVRKVMREQRPERVPRLARTAWAANADKRWVAAFVGWLCAQARKRLHDSARLRIENVRKVGPIEQEVARVELRRQLKAVRMRAHRCFQAGSEILAAKPGLQRRVKAKT